MTSGQIVPSEWFKGLDLSTTKLPREVDAIRKAIQAVMKLPDPHCGGQPIGRSKTGVYAFFDYDGEPIYVGQTAESFGTRVGRHLTGQRSDSVAKYVLDPFEVYAIAMWSLPHIGALPKGERKAALSQYEYQLHRVLMEQSKFKAVLNEGDIPVAAPVDLVEPVGGVIIPNEIFPDRAHPDVRIARRAQTVSLLAKNVSERRVSKGLRRTLLTQSRRLVELSERRFEAADGSIPSADSVESIEASDE